ncbi:MAG: helix-turn-helix transcriptional regulator [Planctomycetes bacterium]|nr:helix-turn-helix transcriptional regulator [Planctomycetota bacterium]
MTNQRAADDNLPFPPLLRRADWERIAGAFELTQRESQVAAMLCRAAGYAAIQAQLRVARPTLRSHLRSVYRKFGCRNRTELILRIVHDHQLLTRKSGVGRIKKSRRSHP